MLQHLFSRTELLIGKESLEKLYKSRITVLGIGGVGSYVVEALARSGVGTIGLVDDDTICLTNLNRQIHATYKTIGKPKVDAMKERILEINPKCNVETYQVFLKPDNIQEVLKSDNDYVVDALDNVTAKIASILWCKENNVKIISCMGTGNKLDPTKFKIADIYDTKICPLCKVMRHELKKRNVENLKVLYSEEVPITPDFEHVVTCKEGCVCTGGTKKCTLRRQIPASISFVPPVAGMIISGEVIKDIINYKEH